MKVEVDCPGLTVVVVPPNTIGLISDDSVLPVCSLLVFAADSNLEPVSEGADTGVDEAFAGTDAALGLAAGADVGPIVSRLPPAPVGFKTGEAEGFS
jgi:hypothetical protein